MYHNSVTIKADLLWAITLWNNVEIQHDIHLDLIQKRFIHDVMENNYNRDVSDMWRWLQPQIFKQANFRSLLYTRAIQYKLQYVCKAIIIWHW